MTAAAGKSKHAAPAWAIPLEGPLTEGECVRLGWPEEAELDAITALRNRPDVRRQFLDQRMLDVERNREWLRHGMKRPYEALLSIRMKVDGAFVGAIGWNKGDPVTRSIELGRVMVDVRTLLRYKDVLPPRYPGVAVDAGTALRNFAFSAMGLRVLRMVVIESNRLSQRAAVVGGARIVGHRSERQADGSEIRLVELECSRDDWLRATGGIQAASRFGASKQPLASSSSP